MEATSDVCLAALAIDSVAANAERKRALFAATGGTAALERLSRGEAMEISGIPRWDAAVALEAGAKAARSLEFGGILAFRADEAGFPTNLSSIYDPPFVLYCRGELPPDTAVAIVGTRRPTGDGEVEAARIARGFATLGFAVVSGLARGIDAAAHRGAIASGGSTWCVLGCGIDTVYPRGNAALARRVMETGGGLLSEYPPGTPPAKWRFPARNRIIAGLTALVAVIEAGEGSGALITAQFAVDEGRDVAVAARLLGRPGNEGCDKLAEDGASELFDAIDAMETAGERGSRNAPNREGWY